MAKPITNIDPLPVDPVKQKEINKYELIDALLEKKESIEGLITLVDKLDERGVIEFFNGLVGKGDKVLELVMQELNKPNATDTFAHFMHIGTFVGRIDTNNLLKLSDRLNKGLEMAENASENDEQATLADILRALKDPNVNKSITMFIEFLKGFGVSQ